MFSAQAAVRGLFQGGYLRNFSFARILKDKFVILGPNKKPVETVYLADSDPVKPWISSGEIYCIVEVVNNTGAAYTTT